jgi:enamine deaminase RidA (YjgF/YER057c/UK114 family)
MSDATIRFVSTVPGLPTPPGYSYAASTSGELVWLAGQVSMDADGNVVAPGDFEAQMRQTFVNVTRVLAEAGCAPTDVLKVTYFVVGLTRERLLAVRSERERFFGTHRPATTLLGIAALFHPDALVEIEVIAHRK